MAYSSDVAVTRLPSGFYLVRVIEQDADNNDESTIIEGLPEVGEIVLVNSHLVSGTAVPGATIQTEIGRAAAWVADTSDEVWDAGAALAAGRINTAPDQRYYAPGKAWYLRSQCSDATADHTIQTEILVKPLEA